MPIRFRCVYCNKLLGIARRKAGAVVNCPQCAEKLIVPTPEADEPDTASKDEGAAEGAGEKPQPLFERADFSALLQGEPTFRMNEPTAVAAQSPMNSTARTWDKPIATPPPPPLYHPQPNESALAPFLREEPPRPPGYFLSPARATWLSVAIVAMFAMLFAAGLLVGKSLK